MDNQQFDQAMGEPPPSTVDVDAVIAGARRAALFRRATHPLVATAAGVIAITFGVAVAVLHGGPAPAAAPADPTATATPASSVLAAVTPAPGCAAPPVTEQPSVAAARLTTVLTSAVHAQLPSATLQRNPAADYPPGTPHGPLVLYPVGTSTSPLPGAACAAGGEYLTARANVANGSQRGNILVVIGWISGYAAPRTECDNSGAMAEQISCVRSSGPHGETILEITLRPQQGPTIYRIEVTKTDGTGIIMHSENVAGDVKLGGPAQSPSPPLTLPQLVAIALDPAMTLYPR